MSLRLGQARRDDAPRAMIQRVGLASRITTRPLSNTRLSRPKTRSGGEREEIPVKFEEVQPDYILVLGWRETGSCPKAAPR